MCGLFSNESLLASLLTSDLSHENRDVHLWPNALSLTDFIFECKTFQLCHQFGTKHLQLLCNYKQKYIKL